MPSQDDDTLPEITGIRGEPLEIVEQIGTRFKVERLIGAGAFGAVYSAHDRIFDRQVAIKFFRKPGERELERFRAETATLRLLRLPGIVEVIDDGVTPKGTPWVATEFIDGQPFPGERRRFGWSELAEPTQAILEALARVHQQGILHLDIKPDNVLIDDRQRVTLLDFGIASGRGYRRPSELAGTPAYVAPEQVYHRARLDERTDLFAVGAMLYEALTGTLPFDAETLTMVMSRATDEPARLLSEFGVDAPDTVIATIESMVSLRPGGRPRNAEAVMELFGRPPVHSPSTWLGDHAPIHRVLDAIDAGAFEVTIGGGPGSGRSRLLQEIRQQLRARGRRTCRWPDLDQDAVWLIDGEEIPGVAWRQHPGPIVHVVTAPGADVELGPLAPSAMESLFHGPELVLSLRSRAAREMNRRTGGNPGAVMHELASWVRTGVGYWDGDRVRISHERLTHLETTSDRVARATMLPSHRRRANPSAPQDPRSEATELSGLDSNAVADALDRGDFREAVRIATAQAERALDAGIGVHAFTAAGWALPLARLTRDEDLVLRAITCRVAGAMDSGMAQLLELAIYEIEQVRSFCDVARIAKIARLALDARGRRPTDDDERRARELGPFENETIEQHRMAVLARRVAADVENRGDLIDELAAWAIDPQHLERQHRLASWIGLCCYETLNFADDLRWQLFAAESPRLSTSLAALGNAMSALVEDGQINEAVAIGERIREHPLHLVPLAGWTLVLLETSIEYRSTGIVRNSADLVDLAALIGDENGRGIVCLTLAASLWRSGDWDAAVASAREAAAGFRRSMTPAGVLLAESLEAACRGRSELDLGELLKQSLACPIPGIRLQALALLRLAGVDPSNLERSAEEAAAALDASQANVRREVLSVDECLVALGVADSACPQDETSVRPQGF